MVAAGPGQRRQAPRLAVLMQLPSHVHPPHFIGVGPTVPAGAGAGPGVSRSSGSACCSAGATCPCPAGSVCCTVGGSNNSIPGSGRSGSFADSVCAR